MKKITMKTVHEVELAEWVKVITVYVGDSNGEIIITVTELENE